MSDATAPKIIKGEDLFIEISDKKCLHATKHTLTVNLNTEEISTIHALYWKYAVRTDWEAQADGVVVIDEENDENANSVEEILDLVLSKTPVNVTLKCSQAGLLSGTYTGTAYIDKFDIDSEVANKATYSIHLTSEHGELTKSSSDSSN